jgi:peptide chain release factor 1
LRVDELNALLASADVTSDIDNYRKLSREHAEISPVVDLYKAYQTAEDDLHTAEEMMQDPDSREFAEGEIRETRERLTALEAELQKQLLPKDPNDERNIFLEIRAGTGGEESALFSADLFRMYSRFAERNRWHVEVISQSASDLARSSRRSRVTERIRGSNSSPVRIACNACRIPRHRAGFTRPPAPSPCCPKWTKCRTSC